jgi:uncharacterized protein (TIGR02217 family)
MSSNIFPTLSGLTFPYTRAPRWRTGIQPALSGKESRIQYRRYPLPRWELNYEILRDDIAVSDVKAIVGLFNACGGSFDTFLYTDPDFNSVTTENFGTGDGVTTQFQLIATYKNASGPGAPERFQNLNGLPQIFKAGVLQTLTTHYTIGPTGIITFVTAPAVAAALTWTGSFYYRCRFSDDELVLSKTMYKWWELMPAAFQAIAL